MACMVGEGDRFTPSVCYLLGSSAIRNRLRIHSPSEQAEDAGSATLGGTEQRSISRALASGQPDRTARPSLGRVLCVGVPGPSTTTSRIRDGRPTLTEEAADVIASRSEGDLPGLRGQLDFGGEDDG